jgi:hypothetical protein
MCKLCSQILGAMVNAGVIHENMCNISYNKQSMIWMHVYIVIETSNNYVNAFHTVFERK